MKRSHAVFVLAGMMCLSTLQTPGAAQSQQAPVVQIPQSGVALIITMEATFVRAAYNNEGYVIIGYQMAQRSIGEEWMLIEMGTTLRDDVPNYKLIRGALSLETPDGKTLPLPSVNEMRAGNTQAVQQRSKVQRDSINYFPPSANRVTRLGFFPTSAIARCRGTRPISTRRTPAPAGSISTYRAASSTASIGST